MISDPEAFILANTRLQPVPHAPEISLWVADELTPIWRLTEEELGEMGVPPPFWAFAWAGGQALSRWLLDHPEEVAGKRVLDFAAGSGLVGIAAMKAGAVSALCADIDELRRAHVCHAERVRQGRQNIIDQVLGVELRPCVAAAVDQEQQPPAARVVQPGSDPVSIDPRLIREHYDHAGLRHGRR